MSVPNRPVRLIYRTDVSLSGILGTGHEHLLVLGNGYASFTHPERLTAIKKEFVASTCRRLNMEHCMVMCHFLAIPEAWFVSSPLGILRQLL